MSKPQDFLSQLEADATDSTTAPQDSELNKVAVLAKKIQAKQSRLSLLEGEMKQLKQELLQLTDEDLPATMQELGLSAFTTDDGASITIKPTYGAYIKVDNREEAYDWLRDNEFGDLIKNSVSCTFGRGEDEIANQFITFAEDSGYSPQQKTEVHPQTLKAWVREQTEAGKSIPAIFGAYVGSRATIKR